MGRSHVETAFLVAENGTINDLHIVGLGRPACDQPNINKRHLKGETEHSRRNQLTSITTIRRPFSKAIYQNIVVSSNTARDCKGTPVTRIAIIWHPQNIDMTVQRGELFIYDFQWQIFIDKHAHDSPYVEGKGIMSFPSTFGGLHKKSPIRDQLSPEPINSPLGRSFAIGGMAFLPRPPIRHRWHEQGSRLSIWGPKLHPPDHDSRTEIELKTLDFSFADKDRLAASRVPDRPEIEVQRLVPFERYGRVMMGPRMLNCCCVLHDETWAVELPSIDGKLSIDRPDLSGRRSSTGLWTHLKRPRNNNARSIQGGHMWEELCRKTHMTGNRPLSSRTGGSNVES